MEGYMNQSWTSALYYEQRVQEIIFKQEQTGVVFDRTKASFLIHVIKEKQLSLYKHIRKYLSCEVIRGNANGITLYLKGGGYTVAYLKYQERSGLVATGSFCPVDFVEPDIGSRTKLIKQLLTLGWKPTIFTDKGTPQITHEKEPVKSLEFIKGLGPELSLYYKYKHRLGQIEGFYKHLYYDGLSWRIPAQINPLATNTNRGAHRKVANIPKAKSFILLGKQMRSLFTVPRGDPYGPIKDRRPYRMMGTDAAGLELRVLAHYVNDKDYTSEIIYGDAHSRHQEMAGLPTRDDAKTFIYAFLYGAGDAKIGRIIGGTAKDGKRIKAEFLKANPKLEALIKGVSKTALRGNLKAIDGRLVHMRKFKGEYMVHKALNTLLQSTGSILVKYGMVILDDWIKALSLKTKQTIWYHDELQFQVPKEEVEIMKVLCGLWMTWAGEVLGCRCPLASDANVGLNWADTH